MSKKVRIVHTETDVVKQVPQRLVEERMPMLKRKGYIVQDEDYQTNVEETVEEQPEPPTEPEKDTVELDMDINDYNVRDAETELNKIDDKPTLQALKKQEQNGKDRKTVIKLINKKL